MATRTKEAPKKPAGETKANIGKVVQVIGPVLDVEFEPEKLPELYNALLIDHPGNGTPPIRLVDQEGVVELRQLLRLELHVEHGADDLDDFADVGFRLARRLFGCFLGACRHKPFEFSVIGHQSLVTDD